MKGPETLSLMRHEISAYNALKEQKDKSPLYQHFKKAFENNPESIETHRLATEVKDMFALGVGDHDTPLIQITKQHTKTVGEKLKKIIKVPDIIFVSPYKRTQMTLEKLIEGWPELHNVKIVVEERIREQDFGLSLLYNDWRIFEVLHPEQKALRKIQGEYWFRYPQGENIPDVRERLGSWLNILTTTYAEQNVFAITHHLTILSLRAILENLGADEFIRLDQEEKPINNGVTIYRRDPTQGSDGELILEQYNIKLY